MPEFERWFGDNGDEVRLLGHDLSSESVVFEVGGYLGEFSEDLFNKFNCNLYVLEPVKEFYNKLCHKFKDDNKISVLNYGLHKENTEMYISVDEQNGENSTVLNRAVIKNAKKEKIILKRIEDVMEQNDVSQIDLLNINIEGGEYDLLNYLVRSPVIYKIKNIQVQFHDFVEDAHVKRNIIHAKLHNTHKMTYNYEFVWENWNLR